MYHKEGAESETAAAEFSLAAAAAADIAVPAPIPLVPTSPTARKQASATEEPAAPDSTAAAVTVPAAQEALSEEFDREWQLPLPPPAEPLSGVPEIAAGATLEAFLQAGDSTSSLSIGGVAQVTESSSPEGHASPEIFLPWDFPALDKTSNPAPAKRARAAAVPAQSAPGRTSPSSDSGQSSDCSHSSPLDLLAATGIASTSTSGEPAAPPLPTLADSELDLLQELHTLPSATPPIRADEIMCNRSLRPRYYAMQLYDDEANEDWVEAEFEDDGVASWLQGATVKPIRSKEPDMYPGLDQYALLRQAFSGIAAKASPCTACSASNGIPAHGFGWRISASASLTSIVGRGLPSSRLHATLLIRSLQRGSFHRYPDCPSLRFRRRKLCCRSCRSLYVSPFLGALPWSISISLWPILFRGNSMVHRSSSTPSSRLLRSHFPSPAPACSRRIPASSTRCRGSSASLQPSISVRRNWARTNCWRRFRCGSIFWLADGRRVADVLTDPTDAATLPATRSLFEINRR